MAAARSAAGFRVATLPVLSKTTLADTALVPFFNVNEGVTVDPFIASENVAVTFVATATPVAPSPGAVAVTVGGVASAVNVQVLADAKALPARSFAPVEIVAV